MTLTCQRRQNAVLPHFAVLITMWRRSIAMDFLSTKGRAAVVFSATSIAFHLGAIRIVNF